MRRYGARLGAMSTNADLFQREESWARFSPCGRYRYTLGRRWSDGPLLGFVGMNPSTAAADREDATSRRFRSFAMREGCGAYETVNLDAMVATDPGEIRRGAAAGMDVTGPENDTAILDLAKRAIGIVLCWGTGGAHRRERAGHVAHLLGLAGVPLVCLGYTDGGHPRHPLYVRGDKRLEPWLVVG